MTRENEGPFGVATRIAAGDDGTNYDPVAIGFHWATALLVLVRGGLILKEATRVSHRTVRFFT